MDRGKFQNRAVGYFRGLAFERDRWVGRWLLQLFDMNWVSPNGDLAFEGQGC